MSRPSSLWLRKRDGFWMTTINGTQHKLSKDKKEARKMLNKLLGSEQPPPDRSGMSTRKLADNYLVRTKDEKSPEFHAVQVMHLKTFCRDLGHRDPAALKVHDIEEWLEKKDSWAKSTRALFITIIKAVFNWGETQGYLASNPIKKLKRQKTGRRGRYLADEERERIKAAVSPQLRDFLELLEQTGCRPFSEGAKLTAAEIDFEKGISIRSKHKTAKKGKTRTLYFPPAILARLKELAEQYPDGPLLRNRMGLPWSKNNAGKYIARVCKRLGIVGVTSYTIRHSMATDALIRGVPVDVLAELIGNSPAVLRSNYAHVEARTDALREAAKKAIGQ